MVRKPKLVAFTPQIGRRIKKNAGGTHTSIIGVDTKPRNTGGGGGTTHWIYTLTSDMGLTATANVVRADFTGPGAPSAAGITLQDTIGLAAWQTTGGKGLCFLGQNGDYWVIVPECEPDE